jgi:hypothetical protein
VFDQFQPEHNFTFANTDSGTLHKVPGLHKLHKFFMWKIEREPWSTSGGQHYHEDSLKKQVGLPGPDRSISMCALVLASRQLLVLFRFPHEKICKLGFI